MSSAGGLGRRDFLRAAGVAGAGLAVAVELTGCAHEGAPEAPGATFAPNAWIRIAEDGKITVIADRSEMGQGTTTGYVAIVADELDADPFAIRYEFAPANEAYYNQAVGFAQMTGGSTGILAGYRPLREAAAKARMLLVSAAAAEWNVPAAECITEMGVVIHKASGKRAPYGTLARRAATLPVPKEAPPLKEAGALRFVGKGIPRVDAPLHVTGRSVFGLDARPPKALVAVVARCPVFGGTVASFDATKAKAMPGVRHVVQLTTGVAVVADTTWHAMKGREALQVTWNEGAHATLSTETQSAEFREWAAQREGTTVRSTGNVQAGLSAPGAKVVEAVYEVPYLAHATMEPMNCTAHVTADGVDVWAPTQLQDAKLLFYGGARGVAAKVAGVAKERVRIHTTHLGGGFGRRAEIDFIAEAVEASKAIGGPVQVVWTREDDMHHDWYRPAAVSAQKAALGADGLPTAWHQRIVAASIFEKLLPGWFPDLVAYRMNPPGGEGGGLHASAVEGVVEMRYAVPSTHVEHVKAPVTVPLGWWRSVGHSHNAFFVESFVDELAHAAGKDPFDYREALLKDHPRQLAVLKALRAASGWGTPLPAGRARGVALHESFGSVVGEVAEVSVGGGAVTVHRVVAAIDCGTAVLPDQVKAQVEGAIVYGLSAALRGEITIAKGAVQQSNFGDYQPLRMREMPVVEVHLVAGGDAPTGAGEPGLPPLAPAVCNALFALTGQRIRTLPIKLAGGIA